MSEKAIGFFRIKRAANRLQLKPIASQRVSSKAYWLINWLMRVPIGRLKKMAISRISYSSPIAYFRDYCREQNSGISLYRVLLV